MKKLLVLCFVSLISLSAHASLSVYGGISTNTDFDPVDNIVIGGNYFFMDKGDFNFGVDLNYTLISGLAEGVSMHPISILGIARMGGAFFAQAGIGANITMTSIEILGIEVSDTTTDIGIMLGGGMNLMNNKLVVEGRILTTDAFDMDNLGLMFLAGYRF